MTAPKTSTKARRTTLKPMPHGEDIFAENPGWAGLAVPAVTPALPPYVTETDRVGIASFLAKVDHDIAALRRELDEDYLRALHEVERRSKRARLGIGTAPELEPLPVPPSFTEGPVAADQFTGLARAAEPINTTSPEVAPDGAREAVEAPTADPAAQETQTFPVAQEAGEDAAGAEEPGAGAGGKAPAAQDTSTPEEAT